MMMPSAGAENPLYGTGVFRRKVRLQRDAGSVRAELEDYAHGFRLRIEHDGVQVTAVASEALRIPLTTCVETNRPLQQLVGCALTIGWEEFRRRLPPVANCTHLQDLAWWSLAHACREAALCEYEVAITDEGDAPSECSVWRNGELAIRLHARMGTVVAPTPIAGQSMMRGFSAWAFAHFPEKTHEAAVMLQRGYFVAQARRHGRIAAEKVRIADFTSMHNVCYSYATGVVERACLTENSERDFTHTPELLLAFR
jgi:hypothetical protein